LQYVVLIVINVCLIVLLNNDLITKLKMKKLFKLFANFILVFAFGFSVQAQSVNGTVTDDNGVPLPGATVLVEGTQNGVSTDFDGNYSIDAASGDKLVFSYVGYSSQTVSVGSSATVNVSLQPDNALSEVVVTALGISREKKSLGYAVSQVSGENVNTVKDHNLANSLSGKVAGLQISQSGSLGSGSRITIRGNNSLGGNTQALIVVDGMPINSSGVNTGSNDDGGTPSYEPDITGGGLSDINPDDVESITVLKGPNAAALYGSRAGNGVILVTTKKGSSSNKLGVTVKTNLSMDDTMFLPDFQNKYGQGSNGASFPSPRKNPDGSIANGWEPTSWGGAMDGSAQPYYNDETKSYTAQPNNVKDFFRQATRSITSISMDKGSESGSIRFSYTNNSSQSILENSDLNSHNFNLRAVANLSDKLTVDTKATYFTQDIKNRRGTGAQGLLAYVYNMPRNVMTNDLRKYQVDNPSSPLEYRTIRYADGTTGNPFWILNNDEMSERRNRFLGFTKVNYEFTDWLSAFVRVGADVTKVNYQNIYKPGHHFFAGGQMQVSETNYGELNSEFLVTAKQNLADKLSLVANIGGNLSKRTSEGFRLSGDNFKIPTKYFIANLNVINAPELMPQSVKKVNSLYGAFNFAYDNFLYLDISARNDWSSTLSEDNRSYLYNSASISAILNKFIDPSQEIFNLIKVRASVAEVGNDTDPYQLYQNFNVPGKGYLDLTTVSSASIKLNPNLKPETVSSSEFGLELSMFDNKLSFDVSVYDITTKDLIFNVPVPAATGFLFAKENIGEVSNKGLEIAIGASLINSEDFSWNTSLFYSSNENKIVKLTDGLDNFVYNQSTDTAGGVTIKAVEGGSIGDIYGFVNSGEVNGDGVPMASSAKDTYLGNVQPDWLGGWSNTLKYKDLSMSFLIDARIGGQIYSQTSSEMDRNGVSERSLQYRDSGVTVPGSNQSITSQEYWTAMANISENYVYDQDNVRLREMSLGYNLPNVSKLGLDSASIQLVGRNLFFFSKSADDIDPESMLGTTLGTQGISHNAMPTLRSVGLNLILNF